MKVSDNNINIIFNPSKEALEEVKKWLVQEDTKNKSGFYCNWNVINELYLDKQFICIKINNEVIGFLTRFYSITNPVIKIAITEITQEHRYKGFGKILVNKCLEYFSSLGVKAVELDCSPVTSKPFWLKMGFNVFPNGFYKDSEYRLYKVLTHSSKTIESNNDEEIIELWNNEPYIAIGEPTWIWKVSYLSNEGVLTEQIIAPAHYDWRIRWRKGDTVFRDDKVKYFFRNRTKEIYHNDFIIIKKLTKLDKD